MNSPHKDYTVKVYSKHDIKIFDENFQTNTLHTDGQSPTEFTTSNYCGMDINCIPNEPYTPGSGKGSVDVDISEKEWLMKEPIGIDIHTSECETD